MTVLQGMLHSTLLNILVKAKTEYSIGLQHPNITTFYDWFESRYETDLIRCGCLAKTY